MPKYKLPTMTPEIIARFEAKFIPEPNSGCWLWFAAANHLGYGKMGIGYRTYIATRISLAIAGRAPHPTQNVCHRCDTPACVNPEHLFVGTQHANVRDMHSKGRAAIGEKMPTAKLTEAQIRGIRFLRSLGRKQNVLAAQYGVGQMTISRIVRRTMWSHVQ